MTNVNDKTRQTPQRSEDATPALLRGEPTVIRQVVFPLRCFDHLKQTQRMYEAEHGVSLNNNQVLALILEQHAQHFPATPDQLRARQPDGTSFSEGKGVTRAQ